MMDAKPGPANRHDPKWKWMVTCYYNDTVKPPKTPGFLAIQTVHATDSSKDMEVQVSEGRVDIGAVDVQLLRP